MLASIGLASHDELFRSIPADVRLNRALNITEPLAESQVIGWMESMAEKNSAARMTSFLGAGVYSHFSPTIVDHLIQRSEFFTSYTPYQPEISQGTLQYIFEFQTLICQLTGMEVANASMYDGSTAMAEAYLMAQRVTRRDKIIVADTVHPEYREVARTYTQHGDLKIVTAPFDETAGAISDLRLWMTKRLRSWFSRRTFLAASKISNRLPTKPMPLAPCSWLLSRKLFHSVCLNRRVRAVLTSLLVRVSRLAFR